MEINNDFIVKENKEILYQKFPLLKNIKSDQDSIFIPIEYTFELRNCLIKIFDDGYSYINSYCTTYKIINALRYLGASDKTIEKSIKHVEDIESMRDFEYMYAVYTLINDMVDWRKFFRQHPRPFAHLEKISSVGLYHDSKLFMDLLLFYKNFDMTLCYDEINDFVREEINTLNSMRKSMKDVFLVDPYNIFDYFKHTPAFSNDNVWKCDNVSIVPKPEYGRCMLSSIADVRKKFEEFTFGLFRIIKKNAVEFPFNNVVFAGGSVMKIIDTNYMPKYGRQSDLDMFIIGKTYEEKKETFDRIIKWFENIDPVTGKTNVFFSMIGSVVNIYIKNVKRVFQIISSDAKSPFDVIDRFDLTHIQWCIHNNKLYGTPGACQSLREKTSYVNNVPRLNEERFIKALYYGYDVHYTAEAKDVADITQLLGKITCPKTGNKITNPLLTNMIRTFQSHWYPVHDDELEPDEEEEIILAQIEKESKVNIVTTDSKKITNEIVIGGDFDNMYASISYTTFNMTHLLHQNNRWASKILLRTRRNRVKLTSDDLIVRGITDNAEHKIIKVAATKEFIAFCEQLEGPVRNMYQLQGELTKKLVAGDCITIKISKGKLNKDNSISFLRDRNGMPLIIDENLSVDDVIQMMFTITLVNNYNNKYIELDPVRLIKVNETVIEDNRDEIHKLTEQLSQKVSFDTVIDIDDEIDL